MRSSSERVRPFPQTETALVEKIDALSFVRTLNDRLAIATDFTSACRALVDLVWEERGADVVGYLAADPQRGVCRLEAVAPAPLVDPAPGEVTLDAAPFSELLTATEPVVLFEAPAWLCPEGRPGMMNSARPAGGRSIVVW